MRKRLGQNHVKMLAVFILAFLPSLAFGLNFQELNLGFMTIRQAEEWLMIATGVTGTAFLGVVFLLFIRRRRMLRIQPKSSPFFFSSDLSSEKFYSSLEKVKEPSFSPLVPEILDVDKNEMSLRLTLAQHYLEIDDRENALALLEEVRWRGQKPEKDLAEKLLNKFSLK